MTTEICITCNHPREVFTSEEGTGGFVPPKPSDGELKRMLRAIYLVLPESVADDVKRIVLSTLASERMAERKRCAEICQRHIDEPYTFDTAVEAENIMKEILNPSGGEEAK
jgi:hypothetical protein